MHPSNFLPGVIVVPYLLAMRAKWVAARWRIQVSLALYR